MSVCLAVKMQSVDVMHVNENKNKMQNYKPLTLYFIFFPPFLFSCFLNTTQAYSFNEFSVGKS